MNRKYLRAVICLALVLLAGLFLNCGPGSSDEGEKALPPVVAAVSISQTLTRTFTLPMPLFAPGSAWTQSADTAAVLPNSEDQILVTYRVLLDDTSDLYPPGPAPTTSTFLGLWTLGVP